jgi:hypothetical protein
MPDASAAATTASSSSARTGNGSTLGGWGRCSEVTTRALNAMRFKGARLTPWCRCACEKIESDISKQIKSKDLQQRSPKSGNLHLGAHPGFLHHAARRALLGGCALQASQLGGCPASNLRLSDDNTLPRLLGADPPASTTADVGSWPPPATRDT